MTYFIQQEPELLNQYDSDPILKLYAQVTLGKLLDEWETDFKRFGDRVIHDILEFGENASQNEPVLMNFDTWGNRVDNIIVCEGWKKLRDVSAEEGLIATGYDEKLGKMGRVIQFIKLYLFTPSSAIYTCPLAMTDGAAKIIKVLGNNDLKEHYLTNLLSKDPSKFLVSGQWMTEKTGGSDLARTETIASKDGENWTLTGPKWFTSAITGNIAMTLARIKGENNQVIEGSRGLSLFMLPLRNENGAYNNIVIKRLKDKLGTRALPTAEVDLVGSKATMIGEKGKGVKNIAIMLNITRIYNSISAVSLMRRAYALARDYADRRSAFGKKLIDLPLHSKTLSDCFVQFVGCFHLTFYVIELLGKVESKQATPQEESLLRLLTPVVKLFTGKQGVSVISELLESMGGSGYLEDSPFPQLLRDAQVLSIWEGTTNVLSLDVIRSIRKENSFNPFIPVISEILDQNKIPQLSDAVNEITQQVQFIGQYFENLQKQTSEFVEYQARSFAFSIAKIMISTLLIDFVNKIPDPSNYLEICDTWIKNNPLDIHLSTNLIDYRKITNVV